MIYFNALSRFIIHHDINGIYEKNLRSIQYLMRTSDPTSLKFKLVCKYFPDIDILTKSATLGNFQQTFMHFYIYNKSPG